MAIKEQHKVIIASIKRQAYNSNQKRERGKKECRVSCLETSVVQLISSISR